MLKVGLTGSIAVGKSFVLSVFRELGCVTIDADWIAHQLMLPGLPAYSEIVSEFGNDILTSTGQIDRSKLGAIVFKSAEKRIRLNQLIHPRVIQEQDRLLSEAAATNPSCITIIDAALMIESGGYKRFDKLIVVFCDHDVQIARLMERNNIDCIEAGRRICVQMPSDEKRRYADFEIDTSAGFEDTRKKVRSIYEDLIRIENSEHTNI